MKSLLKKLKKQYGYILSNYEIISLYQQGLLSLTDKQENEILKLIENN